MKKPLVDAPEARKLIEQYGSPLYVYRKSIIEERYHALEKAIPGRKRQIFYACKANANLEILRLLKRLGGSVECVSKAEVSRAIEAGFPTSRIAYTSSFIPRTELHWLVKKGVAVHLDSLTQVQWWGEISPNSEISVRINRGFGAGATSHVVTGGPESKFGIYYTDIPQLLALAKQYRLTIIGLQQHIGSNILVAPTFTRAMKLLFASASHFPDLAYLDFGGGIGIPYRPTDKPLDIRTLGRDMGALFSKFCGSYGRELELRIEPGRFLVAESGALLATVVDEKTTLRRRFIGVDSGFNHLVRPAFYGAYHHIFNLTNPKGKQSSVTVVGDLCESSDVFARNRKLSEPRIGDILLFADAGAYGYSMASDYNLRPKPKEVFVD